MDWDWSEDDNYVENTGMRCKRELNLMTLRFKALEYWVGYQSKRIEIMKCRDSLAGYIPDEIMPNTEDEIPSYSNGGHQIIELHPILQILKTKYRGFEKPALLHEQILRRKTVYGQTRLDEDQHLALANLLFQLLELANLKYEIKKLYDEYQIEVNNKQQKN